MRIVLTGQLPTAIASRAVAIAQQESASEITVCVSAEPPRRTLKLLSAVAAGHCIVGVTWIDACMAAGFPVPCEPHELDYYGFRLSRQQGGSCALANLRVAIVGKTGVPAAELGPLLVSAGAKLVDVGEEDRLAAQQTSGAKHTPLLVAARGSPWRAIPETEILECILMGSSSPLGDRGGPCAVPQAASSPKRPLSTVVAPEGRRPKRSTRSTSSNAATEAERLELPNDALAGCSSTANAGLDAWLLPATTAGGGSAAYCDEAQYFCMEDSLKLYRHRLPDCDVSSSGQQGAERGRGSTGQRIDFLRDLVEASGARTAVLRRAEGAVLASCTFVLHADAPGLCELQLLAARHSRRGLGSLLLGAVERWLRGAGVKCVVSLAGHDVLSFWNKLGYNEHDVEMEPSWWALLRDPFLQSRLLGKWLN